MKALKNILSVLVTFAVPLFLIMTVIRLLFNPLSLQIEYNLPGFPADPYGFSTEDRLHWGTISVKYIVNNEDIRNLSEQKLSDGQPLYNERELDHMLDVQILFQLMVRVWAGLSVFLILTGVLAWRVKQLPDYWKAVSMGGYLTLGLIGLVLVGIFVGFSGFFTGFHRLFFSGDTWLFNFDDALIRLFPLKLWQDGFTAAGALSGVFGLISALLPGRWSKS